MAARTTAQALQQPIVSSIVNTLGSAVEQTMPLGVMLPQAGQEAACPACVAIRVSAAAGDLGPAFDYYRANIFPLRDIQGIQYAQQLTTLEQYLPTDLAIQGAFLKAVATIQNEPPTRAGYAAVAGPTAPCLSRFNLVEIRCSERRPPRPRRFMRSREEKPESQPRPRRH